MLSTVIKGKIYRLFAETFGHRNYKKFILLSRARTGSTLFMTLMNSHPQVRMEAEIFGRLYGSSNEEILRRAFRKEAPFIQAKGFKLFYYHPLDAEPAQLQQLLLQIPDLHIIHLRRRNILRTMVSQKIASQSSVWRKDNETQKLNTQNKQVEFSVEELEKGFRQTLNWEDSAREVFKNKPFLELTYEDLAQDRVSSMNRAFDFLGLRHHQVKTHLERQNPEPLDSLIRNFAELTTAFSNTQWESYFQEKPNP